MNRRIHNDKSSQEKDLLLLKNIIRYLDKWKEILYYLGTEIKRRTNHDIRK